MKTRNQELMETAAVAVAAAEESEASSAEDSTSESESSDEETNKNETKRTFREGNHDAMDDLLNECFEERADFTKKQMILKMVDSKTGEKCNLEEGAVIRRSRDTKVWKKGIFSLELAFSVELANGKVVGVIEAVKRTKAAGKKCQCCPSHPDDYRWKQTFEDRRNDMGFLPRNCIACFTNKVGKFCGIDTDSGITISSIYQACKLTGQDTSEISDDSGRQGAARELGLSDGDGPSK